MVDTEWFQGKKVELTDLNKDEQPKASNPREARASHPDKPHALPAEYRSGRGTSFSRLF